ncbi:hypothetical protein L2745_14780 [Shewanella xiamenensis]|uniref:hypothetical protein n=1 Tax=Shewanella xiamenensis TaxID=332186 RepID=UPI0016631A0F|nr:hypothetical protein [Shewanella xiamenensis]MCL1071889.1 hypothetical protein [Shewanella xiamenensis]GGM97866.1 hypothetical protein GCM10009124_28520 [Shewanella xiamenensis]
MLELIDKCNSVKDKINLAKIYANMMTNNIKKIYDAEELEESIALFILRVGSFDIPTVELNAKDVLHLITEPYDYGGHTRLCERISAMDVFDSHLLVSQYNVNPNIICRLSGFFDKITISDNIFFEEKILFLFNEIMKYETVVLHIHPSDIESAIAVRLAKMFSPNTKVFFVNHADHIFSFGRTISDVILQISFRGYEVAAANANPYKNVSFLGIPLNVDVKPVFKNKIRHYIMAGSSYKMKPNKKFSIQSKIYDILSTEKESVISIIGVKKTDYWWYYLKLIFPRRIIFYGTLSYDRYLEVVRKADCCIDTGPITGGTTFVEMYLQSLFPLGFHSGICGYTPLDQIRVNSFSEFINLANMDLEFLFHDVNRVHGFESVKIRYLDALSFKFHPIDNSLKNNNNDLNLFSEKKYAVLDFFTLCTVLKLQGITFKQKFIFLFRNFSFLSFIYTFIPKVINKISVN